MVTILRGNIIHTPSFGKLETVPHGYLVLEDGVVAGLFEQLPDRYAACPVEDFGEKLILPAFADLHLHAPQYPMLGMGMDLPLLDWLNTYAFPTEARFADTDYARAGWVSVCIAIAYGLLVMAPWYALWGMPVWDASAPWPF